MVTTAAQIKTAGRAAMLAGVVLAAGGALACSVERTMSDFDLAVQGALDNVFKNKRVRQAADCSFVNGGSGDQLSGAAAVDLGKGRVGQLLEGKWGWPRFAVVQCAEHEVLFVTGRATEYDPGGSCASGIDFDLTSYLPGTGRFDYAAGEGFSGLKQRLDRADLSFFENIEVALDSGYPKDRVNLLCGCQVFYPETME